MTELKPIETAPKDGTHFVAYQNGEVYRCRWRNGVWWDYSTSTSGDPTHWIVVMPALSGHVT